MALQCQNEIKAFEEFFLSRCSYPSFIWIYQTWEINLDIKQPKVNNNLCVNIHYSNTKRETCIDGIKL